MSPTILKIVTFAGIAIAAAGASQPAKAQGLAYWARVAQQNQLAARNAMNQAYMTGFSPAARQQAELNTSTLRLQQQIQSGYANMAALRARQAAVARGYAFSRNLRVLRRAVYW
jgi:hypothetical protein